jgi:glycopeptide antibiotics resistance protein
MKYIKELIGVVIIIILTVFIGMIPFVQKLSNLFIPSINRYIYIGSFFSFIYIMGRTIINKKQKKLNIILLIITYSILLFLTLFVRSKYDTYKYDFSFYLLEWFTKMFTSKVIFINLIGNLVLFMPLGFILSNINKGKIKRIILNIILGMGIIVVLEFCQFITKRGVLDLMDILLNSTGLIIGVLVTKKGEINEC